MQPKAEEKPRSRAEAVREAARQQHISQQLRADSRPATARGADTGRSSDREAVADRPTAAAAREVTEKVAGRQAAEERRPKTDAQAVREAARANAVAERGNRGRDDDSGRDR